VRATVAPSRHPARYSAKTDRPKPPGQNRLAALFNWGNAGWLAVTLGGVVVAVPLLLRGVVISARASFIMFCSEALGLIILSIVVLSLVHGSHLGAPFHANGGSPGGFRGLVGLTFALAVSGFIGWENSGALAEESRNPKKYIPITVYVSVAIITVLYVLSSWAAVAGYADWKGPRGRHQLPGQLHRDGSLPRPVPALQPLV
jgi:amino acid transporter